jgi:hypothetical protein
MVRIFRLGSYLMGMHSVASETKNAGGTSSLLRFLSHFVDNHTKILHSEAPSSVKITAPNTCVAYMRINVQNRCGYDPMVYGRSKYPF